MGQWKGKWGPTFLGKLIMPVLLVCYAFVINLELCSGCYLIKEELDYIHNYQSIHILYLALAIVFTTALLVLFLVGVYKDRWRWVAPFILLAISLNTVFVLLCITGQVDHSVLFVLGTSGQVEGWNYCQWKYL